MIKGYRLQSMFDVHALYSIGTARAIQHINDGCPATAKSVLNATIRSVADRMETVKDTEPLLLDVAEALQRVGIMPNDATTSELKATKYHLEDMRKLIPKSGGSLGDEGKR